MKNIQKNLTIFMIAYHSNYRIENVIKKINPKIKILIIENLNLIETKNYFEKKFKNVKVILSKVNLGMTGGVNLAFKNIKTKYSIYLDMDINFSKGTIERFFNFAEKTKNFAFLVPNLQHSKYPKYFYFEPKKEDSYSIRLKIAHFHFVFYNMKATKDIGLYDKNIFFYYDETDYCLRAIKKNYNIFLLKNVKVKHLENQSYKKNIRPAIEPLRQWHLMWGKFYFNKKHYGSFNAYKYCLPNLCESFFKMIVYSFFDGYKCKLHVNRLSGLLNSMFGKKSWKRFENYS